MDDCCEVEVDPVDELDDELELELLEGELDEGDRLVEGFELGPLPEGELEEELEPPES
jgi:hypothetical protein